MLVCSSALMIRKTCWRSCSTIVVPVISCSRIGHRLCLNALPHCSTNQTGRKHWLDELKRLRKWIVFLKLLKVLARPRIDYILSSQMIGWFMIQSDWKIVFQKEPTNKAAQQNVRRLEPIVAERTEKQKEEVLGSLNLVKNCFHFDSKFDQL